MADVTPFRVYELAEPDGYPAEWSRLPRQDGDYYTTAFGIKHLVREQAGHRCVRCHHPYRVGEHGNGEWSHCDADCDHGMPARDLRHPFGSLGAGATTGALIRDAKRQGYDRAIEAQWRILTVHHLNGNKLDCRWWNLVALCQRCHLTIQGRVVMARVWPWEHTDWFKPYVAGYYAFVYEGRDVTRAEAEARLDELLAYELAVTPEGGGS